MATKTIGYDSTGAAGDYTSWATWLTYIQGLGTLAAPEFLDVMNGTNAGRGLGSMTAHSSSGAPVVTLSGFTPTVSNPLTIRGKSAYRFRDATGVQSNPLRPVATGGATLARTDGSGAAITISVPFVTLRDLQITNTASSSQAVSSETSTNTTIDSCILQSVPTASQRVAAFFQNSSAAMVLQDTLVIDDGGGSLGEAVGGGQLSILGCTIVRPGGTPSGTGISSHYGQVTIKGTAVFGFATLYSAGLGGAINAASNYNATDQATGGTGYPATANNLFSQTYTACFVNTSSTAAADYRIANGTPLMDAAGTGTTITGLTTDIVGTTRAQGSNSDIGAWEFLAATATTFTLTGPSSGTVGNPSTNFTYTPNGNYTGTITPTMSVISGTWTPSSLTWSGTATAQTATFTASSAGTGNANGTGSPSLTQPANVSYTATSAALAVARPTYTCTKTSVTLAASVTGGTGPYSYSWKKSSTFTGTYSTFGAANASSVTDSGLTYRSVQFYKVVVTDNVSATATSLICSTSCLPRHSLGIGLMGDSITNAIGVSGATTIGSTIYDTSPNIYDAIPTDNQAVGSTWTDHWMPTSANWTWTPLDNPTAAGPNAGTVRLFDYATTQWTTSLVGKTDKYIVMRMGTGDANHGNSAATFKSQMQAIIAGLVGLGFKCILDYPIGQGPHLTDDNGPAIDLLKSYQAQIDSLVDNVNVFQGDQDGYAWFQGNNVNSNFLVAPESSGDGLHPPPAGTQSIQKLIADAVVRVVEREGHAVAGGSAVFNPIGCGFILGV